MFQNSLHVQPRTEPFHPVKISYLAFSTKHYILLLLRSDPNRQHSKVLYHWGVQENRKDRKRRKSRSEEKLLGFSSASYYPQGNGRQSPRVEPG